MGTAILGVDPGRTGAIAIIDHHGQIIDIEDMPPATGAALGACIRSLLDDLASWTIDRAYVEAVHSMPRQGVRSVWTFAEGHGAILGALGALGIPVELVPPATWKKAMRVTANKGTSRQRALELWPSEAERFRRVKDDGRAEACLIAEHGRMTR